MVQEDTEQPARRNREQGQPLALVTGASRGLGYGMAVALGRRGWHVLLAARTLGGLEGADDAVRAAGGSATIVPLDITEEDKLRQMCRAIFERWGRLDLWVHAAIHPPLLSPAPHVNFRDFDRAWAVNAQATQRLISFLDPLLRAADKGCALFFDDPMAGQRFAGGYGATKAAQIALARSWVEENRRIGPKIMIETPPPMRTALRARFFPGEDRSALADPQEVAEKITGRICDKAPGPAP